jgi:leucyl aminopeptidase
VVTALGYEYAGIFASDDALADQLIAAGCATGDRLWRFPMGERYDKLLASPIADMKNVAGREASSIIAAQFIRRFVDKDVAWAHLDISGTAWAEADGHLWARGATGFGVRLLDQFIADNHERR